ncbi:MAG: DUF1501 domain-containing protein [Chloroflexi bacterium]|nr:DUF1501 domain-containing protein [Chloroflexota bacterium]
MTTQLHCDEYDELSRGSYFFGGFGMAPGVMSGVPSWMPGIRLADPNVGPAGDTLVCIFLRGGIDGLNVIVPHGDDEYYRQRPTLAIPRPGDAQASVVDLDGFFGLHPMLEPLHAIYEAGSLAVVHATGSPDDSHSHFQAMAAMERGVFAGGTYSGWLARHLATYDTGNSSALRAMAVGEMLPLSLSGTPATALQSLSEYRLAADDNAATLLGHLYQGKDDLLSQAARQTLDTLRALRLAEAETREVQGRAYPETDFGRAMHTVADLLDMDVGVEVACVDLDGWDTHAGQGAVEGFMATNLDNLAQGLTAFYEDMGPRMGNITVLVMSEFGRRVRENAALGTDHGTGNMLLLMGDGLNGGQVHSTWPGLHPEQQTGPGDLTITVDYRHILAEITLKRLNNPRIAEVFPGFETEDLGIAKPRA